jgi:AcrR family transcriptional regulator
MRKTDTKTRILDAAENVFARAGYRDASLRVVTGRAGVNLAAVNYHFGSKEDLLRAVLERRVVPLNAARQARMEAILDAARRSGRLPGVREILGALVASGLDQAGEGARYANFKMLMGRSLAEPDGTVRRVFHAFNRPMVSSLRQALRQALPRMDEFEIYWRVTFAIGALILAQRFQADPPPDMPARRPGKGRERVAAVLTDFITAGMEGQGSRADKRRSGRNAAGAVGVEKDVRKSNQAGRREK